MKPFVASMLIVSGMLLFQAPAFGWGQTGHRVIGEIAERHLSAEAKAEIETLLGPETLAEASTWPDFMRSSRDAFWTKEASPYHYVTIPTGETYSSAEKPEEGDAIIALSRFKHTLLDEAATPDEKRLALRFIIHIIGDLHQPLHAGDGTDRGGNDVTVTFFGELTNLHSVWDTQIVDSEKLSYTEWSDWLDARISAEEVDAWSNSTPADWADESADIRNEIYPEDDERDLSYGYVFDHRDTVRLRLSQGGIRLADYLNDVFGPHS